MTNFPVIALSVTSDYATYLARFYACLTTLALDKSTIYNGRDWDETLLESVEYVGTGDNKL